MKSLTIKCVECGKNLIQDDCRLVIPVTEIAKKIRDHKTVFHNDDIEVIQNTKEANGQ